MIPGYRYRYAPTDTDTDTDIPIIPHTEPITDTGFIPIPGISTWYRYRYKYPVLVEPYTSSNGCKNNLSYSVGLIMFLTQTIHVFV